MKLEDREKLFSKVFDCAVAFIMQTKQVAMEKKYVAYGEFFFVLLLNVYINLNGEKIYAR
jgi:hypothetical protein